MTTLPGDQARVTVSVAVPPAVAFEIFTDEIDQWWRRGRRFRRAGQRGGFIRLEPGVGGRLLETVEPGRDGAQAHVFEVGRVLVWEPPARIAFSWRNENFTPDEITNVDVLFTATPSGTLVTVTHKGWSALRPDHPARHGQPPAELSRKLGLWWGDLLSSFRERCAQQ